VARPREFEREEVVEKALGVFWRQGYQATSVQDLVEATGLNRGSLYDTFGDKHGLFLEVVEHYRSHVTARRLAKLEEPGPARAKIETFFKASPFVQRFADKSPMEGYFEDIPVHLITSKNTALIGAAKLLEDNA